MRADPCLACGCLNLRRDDAPAPLLCPRCGRDTLLYAPAPRPIDALRDQVARRIFAVDGDREAPL